MTGLSRLTLRRHQMVASEGFAAFLADEQVAVAVVAAGRLHVLSSSPEDGSSVELGLDEVAAVEWDRDRLWSIDRFQLWAFVDAVTHSAPPRPGRRLLVPQSAQTLGFVAPSDLVITDRGPLVVSALFSCLAVIDDHYSFRPVWMPPWVSALVPEMRTWLTGAAVRHGVVTHVTAATKGDVPNSFDPTLPTGTVVTPDGQEVCGNLSVPRHPRWWGETLLVAEAGTGRLLAVDHRSATTEVVTVVPGVAGGLAIVGNLALVGYSHPLRAGIEGLAGGGEAAPGDGVCLVDLVAGTIVGTLSFQGHAGPVQSIAAIPQAADVSIAPPRGLVSQTLVVPGRSHELGRRGG